MTTTIDAEMFSDIQSELNDSIDNIESYADSLRDEASSYVSSIEEACRLLRNEADRLEQANEVTETMVSSITELENRIAEYEKNPASPNLLSNMKKLGSKILAEVLLERVKLERNGIPESTAFSVWWTIYVDALMAMLTWGVAYEKDTPVVPYLAKLFELVTVSLKEVKS